MLTYKEYIHISEIPEILKGRIEIGGEIKTCPINPKTELAYGLIEGTTPENFAVNVGGWNCRHQLVPIADEAVPKNIREKFKGRTITPKELKESLKKGRAKAKQAYETFKDTKNEFIPEYNDEIINNTKEIAKILGIEAKGEMTFNEADSGKANIISNKKEKIFRPDNCVNSVVAFEMRKRGLQITSTISNFNNELMSSLSEHPEKIWRTTNGEIPSVVVIAKNPNTTISGIIKRLNQETSQSGRYQIWYDEKGGNQGHILTMERTKNGKLFIYDAQHNDFYSIEEILQVADIDKGIELLKNVERLKLYPEYAELFLLSI